MYITYIQNNEIKLNFNNNNFSINKKYQFKLTNDIERIQNIFNPTKLF